MAIIAFGEGIQVVDPYDGRLRTPVKADLCAAGHLVDFLDDVDVMEKAVGCNDVPQEVAAIHNAHAMLTNTTKQTLLHRPPRLSSPSTVWRFATIHWHWMPFTK